MRKSYSSLDALTHYTTITTCRFNYSDIKDYVK